MFIQYTHTEQYTCTTIHITPPRWFQSLIKMFSQIEKMNNLDNNLKIFSESLRNGAKTAK